MTRSEFLYEIIDLKNEHGITNDQALFLLASFVDIEWDLPNAADILSFVNKGLIKPGNKVNKKVLFRQREPEQQSLELTFESKPKSSEEALERAHRIESKLVIDKYNNEEFRKTVADKFFKGDKTVARYFIIFKSMFPVKDKSLNKKWNSHFGIVYDNSSRWDSSVRVAKKFHEIYTKKDIGIFLIGTYFWMKDNIDYDMESCFCTKPYKYLAAYSEWYDLAKEKLDTAAKVDKKSEEQLPINSKSTSL